MDKDETIDVFGGDNRDFGNEKTYHHPIIGQMTGGSNTIHTNEGKDKVIEALTQKDGHRQETFIHELHGFREYIMRQDDEIKRLSERVDRIIKHSYLRNERNMERINTIWIL